MFGSEDALGFNGFCNRAIECTAATFSDLVFVFVRLLFCDARIVTIPHNAIRNRSHDRTIGKRAHRFSVFVDCFRGHRHKQPLRRRDALCARR